MNSFEQMMSQARRRELTHRALRLAGWGLAAGVILGVALVLLDRLTAAAVPLWMYPTLAALGAAAGLVTAAFTLPGRLLTAVTIDRTLRLKDRIGTVQSLDDQDSSRRPAHDPEFIELLRQDAQRLAQRVDVREATPIHFTGIWGIAILGVAALLAMLQFVPEVDWSMRSPRRVHSLQQIEQAQVQSQQIAQTLEQTLAELPKGDPALDDQAREELTALERLADQLARREATPDEVNQARDESAARLNELADRLADQARRDMAASEELARRFSGMDAMDRPTPPMSAAEFDEAIRRGDFGAASRELDELLHEARDLPPVERHAAAEHLRDLADQIRQPDEVGDQLDQPQDELTDALRDLGLDEEVLERFRENPPSIEEMERALRQMGVDESVARQMAQDVQEQQEQLQQRDQIDRDAQDVSDALDQAADEIEQPPPPAPSTQPQPSQPQPADQTPPQPQQESTDQQSQPDSDRPAEGQPQPQSGETQPDQSQQQQQPEGGNQKQPGGQSPQNQQEKEQQQPRSTGEQPQQQEPGATQQEQPGTSSHQQGARPQPQPSSQQQPSSSPQRVPEEEQPTPGAQQREGSQQRDDAGDPGRDPEQSEAQGEQEQDSDSSRGDPSSRDRERQPRSGERAPDEQQQGEQSAEGSDGQPPRSADAIRRMAERMRQAQDRQRSSEQMREAARRIAENMSPQERERWAEMWRRQMGQPPPTGMGMGPGDEPARPPQLGEGDPNRDRSLAGEDLDLRGEEVGDQVIAQWLTNEPLQRDPDAAPEAAPAQRVRQAQSVAERAVNEATVHRRYHRAIKRYFGRLDRAIEGAQAEE